MSQELVTKVNEAQQRWKLLEANVLEAKNAYNKCVEASYEGLKECNRVQTELLIALCSPAQASQEAASQAPQAEHRTDNVD